MAKTLYIYFHVPKCAGNTLTNQILQHYKPEEILEVYTDRNKAFGQIDTAKQFFKELSQERKDKINIVDGHQVFYGIHTFFSHRECKYLIFLRHPFAEIVSWYNFLPKQIERAKSGPPDLLEFYENSIMYDGKMIPFNEFLEKSVFSKNYLTTFLLKAFLYKQYLPITEEDFTKIKKILSKFYFIGLVEHPKDIRLFYQILGITPSKEKRNVSHKYFTLNENDLNLTMRMKTLNSYDLALYRFALELNRKQNTFPKKTIIRLGAIKTKFKRLLS